MRDPRYTVRACLHDQWLAERDAWPQGPGFVEYTRFVAAHPGVFGYEGAARKSDMSVGLARPLIEEARALVLLADRPPTRWEDSGTVSPSGKTILRCRGCDTLTTFPTDCRAKCSDAHIAWGWPP